MVETNEHNEVFYESFFNSTAKRFINQIIEGCNRDNRIHTEKGTRIILKGNEIKGPSFDHNEIQNGISFEKIASLYENKVNSSDAITPLNQITHAMLRQLKVAVLCCFCNTTLTLSFAYFQNQDRKNSRIRCNDCKVSHPLLLRLINGSDDVDHNGVEWAQNKTLKKTAYDSKKSNLSLNNFICTNLTSWEKWNQNHIGGTDLITNNTFYKLLNRVQKVHDYTCSKGKLIRALKDLIKRRVIRKRKKHYWLIPGRIGLADLPYTDGSAQPRVFADVAAGKPRDGIDSAAAIAAVAAGEGWLQLYKNCSSDFAKNNQTPPTELPPPKTLELREGVDFIHLGEGCHGPGSILFMESVFGRDRVLKESDILLKECANDPIAFRDKYFSDADVDVVAEVRGDDTAANVDTGANPPM